jgi:hypothetical protein
MNAGGFTFGGAAYFAGGQHCVDLPNCTQTADSDTVERFDAAAGTWSYAAEKLPAPAAYLSCVSLDAAVVCAAPPSYFVWRGPGSPWSAVKQSIHRIEFGFAPVGGRWAVFAGGEAQPDDHSKAAGERVDVYDAATGAWDSGTFALSSAKKKLACGGAGGVALCGGGFDASGHGGYMDTVDVFNLTAGTRTAGPKLRSKRMFLGGGGAAHTVVIAGGLNAPDKAAGFDVDVYDARAGTMRANVTTTCGAHRYFLTSATAADRWIFFGPGMGGKGPPATLDIDMYDTATDYMYHGGAAGPGGMPLMTAMFANGAAAGNCTYWANGGARAMNYHAVANQAQAYCVSGC